MTPVNAKCTNCGANLEVDSNKDAAICPHCQSAFVVEKAISLFRATPPPAVDDAETVSNPEDFVILNGTLMKYTGTAARIRIPDGVVSIGPNAFRGCEHLIAVELPDSVTTIGHDAFCGCTGLTGINIPDSLTLIEDFAFISSGLTSITIPESVVSIGQRAFYSCSSLREVTILGYPNLETNEESDESYEYVFDRCDSLLVINASEDWKRTFYRHARCLYSYDPEFAERRSPRGGCYIATCVYGSYDCPQVWTLRRFRDHRLSETAVGRLFIRCYYATSPLLVKWLGDAAWFRRIWKTLLDSMVARLNDRGVDDTPYTDQ